MLRYGCSGARRDVDFALRQAEVLPKDAFEGEPEPAAKDGPNPGQFFKSPH
jgi:hypothetical protein